MTSARASENRHALITGASAGIGHALAHVFARQGFDLVLTARRADRLNALKMELESKYHIRAHALPADLSNPNAPGDIAAELARKKIHIDCLVNNAGYNKRGAVPETSLQEKNDLLQVMAISPYVLTHFFPCNASTKVRLGIECCFGRRFVAWRG